MRIELTWPAWKAGVLPLNYTRISLSLFVTQRYILYHFISDLSRLFGRFFYLCRIAQFFSTFYTSCTKKPRGFYTARLHSIYYSSSVGVSEILVLASLMKKSTCFSYSERVCVHVLTSPPVIIVACDTLSIVESSS